MNTKFLVTLIAAVLMELSSANSNNQEDAKNVSAQGLLTSELDRMILGEEDSNGEVQVAEEIIITLDSQVPPEDEEDSLELTEDEDDRSKNETTRAIFYTGEDGLTRHSSKICKMNYKRCRSDSECCSQLCHYDHPELPDGYCKEDECRRNYQRCRSPGECCSKLCFFESQYDYDGYCKEVSDKSHVCKKNYQKCRSSAECCSEFCFFESVHNYEGFCKEQPQLAPVLPISHPPVQPCRRSNLLCYHNEDCCSNRCLPDSSVPTRGICGEEIVIPSGAQSTWPACKTRYQRCRSSEECCSKYCRINVHLGYDGYCEDAAIAMLSQVTVCKGLAEPCQTNSDCCPQSHCQKEDVGSCGLCVKSTGGPSVFSNMKFVPRQDLVEEEEK